MAVKLMKSDPRVRKYLTCKYVSICSCTCCIVAQVGVISEAAGSAYIEMMKTKVICAMYANMCV